VRPTEPAETGLTTRTGTSPDDIVELTGVVAERGETRALDGVDLRIRFGERVAIVGPSGAGKSTLLALINTTLGATSGRVTVAGRDVDALGPRALRDLRRTIATVPQGLHLAGPLKVVHNVNSGRLGSWSSARALRSLVRPADTARVEDVLGSLGIAHTMWRRTDSLSGGERQRVALARMLIQDADLVLADEPTANLDPARARAVVEALVEAVGLQRDRHRAVIVALHDVRLATAYFDRIVGLDRGRVVLDRPAGDVDESALDAWYGGASRSGPERGSDTLG
jgi:phosphonate transport system ATP-binding protein